MRVDVSLALVAGNAGVRTVIDDVQILGSGRRGGVAEGKVEELAEVDEVRRIDVSLTDDRNRLPGAVDRCGGVPQRKNVVDRSEVVRCDPVGYLTALIDRKTGLGGCLGLQR